MGIMVGIFLKNITILLKLHYFQSAGFSVSLVDGKISVISDPGGEKLSLMSRVNTYNDGRWHYISVMKKGTLYVHRQT
ncbi:hypothetical protein DPMN_063900 [Dreissena polymorpha]|uniref:Laminin G domain-containing protein n=1 Tax=Dreissena polymorpha TaxID=45954 RepID=A0A9D4CCM2_DREPO|nr:hypothetical protein DPMN_063900 [Dreissena polymorpha]